MKEKMSQHMDAIKWTAHFSLVPLHWLGLANLHLTATAIGAAFMVLYVLATIYHARENGIHHQASVEIDKK